MKISRALKLLVLPLMASIAVFVSTGSAASTHRWAWGQQQVDNKGGDSRLNVWSPSVAPGVFSLSQHWYSGGEGDEKQTVEGGWQVYPNKYGNNDPALFIFFTPDDYASGCYNLDCPGFVQVNNTWVLGGRLAPQSTDGGTQYIIRMQWQLYEGNWWLFVKGNTDYIAVGYYPGSAFNDGQLSQHAEYVKYGGEVASTSSSSDTGEMGSGQFANTGWSHAAYQRTIYYIDTSLTGRWANMSAHETAHCCYTIDMHNNTGGSWGTYFYFGGPGYPIP